MSSRFRIAIGLSLFFVLGPAVPVLAGGWAVITLDELPTNVTAGEPVNFGFTVLQHGRTPLAGLEPTVTARSADGEKIVVFAEPEGKLGHYVATFALSKAGDWEWSIQAFTMDQPMPVLSVAAPSAASGSELKVYQAAQVYFAIDIGPHFGIGNWVGRFGTRFSPAELSGGRVDNSILVGWVGDFHGGSR